MMVTPRAWHITHHMTTMGFPVSSNIMMGKILGFLGV
jgi:hypothetical protein